MKIFILGLKVYKPVIIISLLVGLVYISHHFFMVNNLGDKQSYSPVFINGVSDDNMYYAARAMVVYSGRWIARDPNLSEYQDGPPVLPVLNPMLLGGVSKLFGSIKQGLIISDFIFPTLIFLVIYFLALEISQRKLLSLLFAIVFIFAPGLSLLFPPYAFAHIIELIKSIFPVFGDAGPLYFSRLEYPKLTFFFYGLVLLLTLRALKRKDNKSVFFAGISFGLLFYTYLYDWASFLSALLIMIFFNLIQKNYVQTKRIITIILIGLIVSIPYWVNFWLLHNMPQYDDIVARIGMEATHSFRLISVWKSYFRIAFLFIMLSFLSYKDRIKFNFLAGLLLAYCAVINMQVITGFNPQPDHWHKTQFLAISLVVFMIIIWFYDKLFFKLKFKRFFAYAFVLLLLFSQFYGQYVFSKLNYNRYTMPKDYREAYGWLNSNTPNASVVGSISFEVNTELLVHTHNKVFIPSGYNTLAPTNEIWQRSMILSKLYGLNDEEYVDFVEKGNVYLFSGLFLDHSHDSYFRSSTRNIPSDLLKTKEIQYSQYIFSPDTISYQLDYLFFEDQSLYKDPIVIYKNLKKLYENKSIKIYQVF